MIANFFQSLRSQGVSYFLINGQATVLYGAAEFSEDVDLWINPAQDNVNAFLEGLSSVEGRYYELTPPVCRKHMLRGHTFQPIPMFLWMSWGALHGCRILNRSCPLQPL